MDSGEFGEGGEDEVLVGLEEEARGAEGGAAGVADSDAGVEVAGDSGLVFGKVGGVVGDGDSFDEELGEDLEGEFTLGDPGAGIVVSFGEDDGYLEFAEEVLDCGEDGFVESIGGVDEVSGYDELGGVGDLEKAGESVEVGLGSAFGHGEASFAEGGGFTEMEVGDDEGL